MQIVYFSHGCGPLPILGDPVSGRWRISSGDYRTA